MTDKKLTDEETIGNLTEVLIGATDRYSAYLENGGITDKNQEQYIEILADGINLINRQKAEIEWLRDCMIVNNIMESQRIKREAKTEAYKEFAERLKKETLSDRGYDILQQGTIDNLLKEMVGEKE